MYLQNLPPPPAFCVHASDIINELNVSFFVDVKSGRHKKWTCYICKTAAATNSIDSLKEQEDSNSKIFVDGDYGY